MKVRYLIFAIPFLIMACQKEMVPANRVRIRIVNPVEDVPLDGFTYKIESYGVAYANHCIDKEGEIPNGEVTFSYNPGRKKFRTHELTVSSNGMKGHFLDNRCSTNVGSKGNYFIFYFIPK